MRARREECAFARLVDVVAEHCGDKGAAWGAAGGRHRRLPQGSVALLSRRARFGTKTKSVTKCYEVLRRGLKIGTRRRDTRKRVTRYFNRGLLERGVTRKRGSSDEELLG